LHAAWFIASFGARRTIGFPYNINVGTEFVPNTRLDPLIERHAPIIIYDYTFDDEDPLL
jgi:hypothetical protein